MATIDSNIALGARPVQIDYPKQESPMNQMAAIMQLQNAQQTNQLNRQKFEEYMRARQTEGERRNALAGIKLDEPDSFNRVAQKLYDMGDLTGAQDMLKARADLEFKQAQTGKEKSLSGKADVESKVEKTKLFITQLPIIAQNPTDQAIEQWASLLVQNGVMSMEQATAGMNQMLALPPEQRSKRLMQSALTAKDALEQHYVQQDFGGKKQIVAMPKYGEGKATVIKEDQVTLTPYEKGKLDIDRYKASKGDGGGVSEAPKLKQGERWNKELGRVEAVPGSDIYVKQSAAHGKDFQALQGVDTKVDSAINKIDYILSPENKSGFEANFGGYNAYVASRIPGKATDIRKNIDSLKSDLKAAGLELMRSGGSIGQITEREWPIIEGMIGALSPEMSEDEARLQFGKIKTYMDRIRTNAREAYDTEWGGSQYHKGGKKPAAASNAPASGAPAVGTVKDGYRFKGGNPADAKSWEKL